MRQTLTPIATSTDSAQPTHSVQTCDRTPSKSVTQKLVAQWLRDENSKLYCQWVMI
ncbi:MAG: hypothetical protein HC780_18255 [Leptolyngbyaceae cyanobacterium CSU_1_3]|nr:hypothetical protein [Leptolyngbyaceae cyanobacterium CSU_1_3]